MAGKVGRGGRKKVASTLINEALERVDERIPELFNKLIEKGLQGDRECLIYLIDRRLGKPRATADVNVEGSVDVGLMVEILKQIHSKRELESGAEEIIK